MFNNQSNAGYNPLAGNIRQPQMSQGPGAGMPGMWPGPYIPSAYPQDRQSTGGMWIIVNNLDEAENAFVQPGERKWFMVADQMTFAVKSVSSAGVMDFEAFDFTPRPKRQSQQSSMSQESVQPNVLEEITKAMQGMVGKLNELEATVEDLRGEKENGKSAKQVSGSAARTGSGAK